MKEMERFLLVILLKLALSHLDDLKRSTQAELDRFSVQKIDRRMKKYSDWRNWIHQVLLVEPPSASPSAQ